MRLNATFFIDSLDIKDYNRCKKMTARRASLKKPAVSLTGEEGVRRWKRKILIGRLLDLVI